MHGIHHSSSKYGERFEIEDSLNKSSFELNPDSFAGNENSIEFMMRATTKTSVDYVNLLRGDVNFMIESRTSLLRSMSWIEQAFAIGRDQAALNCSEQTATGTRSLRRLAR